MKNSMFSLSLILLLASCQGTNETVFRQMTDEELIAYNASVPLEDNVHCFNEARTGSYIRKKHCMTLRDIANQMNDSSLTLSTLSQNRVPYYGSLGGRD